MPNPPRKHHFVQAEHIRQFVDDKGVVHVYAKNGSKFVGTPESVYKQKDLNSFDTPEGLETSFETWITGIENDCWPEVRKVVESEKVQVDGLEKVAKYLALSRLRNPAMQKGVVDQYRQLITSTAKFMDRAGKFDHICPMPFAPEKSVAELLDEGLLQINVNNSQFLKTIVELIDKLVSILVGGFNWCVVRSSRDRVVVSDHPLTFVHPGSDFGPYGMPFGGKGCEVAFPISKKLYLVGIWGQNVSSRESEDVVDELNKRQAMFASRHIASRHNSRKLSELAARYRRYSYQLATSALNMADGAYHISRTGVFPIDAGRPIVGKHPLTKVHSVSRLLTKRMS